MAGLKKILITRIYIIFLILIMSGTISAESNIQRVEIFTDDDITFAPDSIFENTRAGLERGDNGRMIATGVTIPAFTTPARITAHLTLKPIPLDDRTVCDKWDRGGSVRLVLDGQPPVEVVKFITSYGGRDEHAVDISHLAPLLKGHCRFEGAIDTWVNPAWKMDLYLEIDEIEDETEDSLYVDFIYNPDWAIGLFYDPAVTAEKMPENGYETEVVIPEGMRRVVLNFLSSGHCTDGSGADEFVPKDHVIYVDGRPVYRFMPWRDDCRRFRENNPYTARWSDGYWSSDFSRSGWCPGDYVTPEQIDLTDYLSPGHHKIGFIIENIRPKDENNHHGVWRVSAHLIGWKDMVRTVKW